MKISFYALLLFFLSSCAVRPAVVKQTSSFDFRKHTDQGFYLSESDQVKFDYVQVASVNAIFKSGYELEMRDGKPVMVKDVDGNLSHKVGKNYVIANLQETLDMLCQEAKDKGANGIINLKFSPTTITTKMGTSYTGFQVSGWAIKR